MIFDDFVLVGDSFIEGLSTAVENFALKWSNDWFGSPSIVSTSRYGDAVDWGRYQKYLLSDSGFSLYMPVESDICEVVFSRYFNDFRGCESFASYYLSNAFESFFSEIMGIHGVIEVGCYQHDIKSNYAGFIVFSVNLLGFDIKILCKVMPDRIENDYDTRVSKMDLVGSELVNVEIGFCRSSISLSDLLSIKDGDVIELNHSVGDSLRLICNNQDVGKCNIGSVNGFLAAKILGE